MSNIIRFHQTPTVEKKVIQTKRIETQTNRLNFNEQSTDPFLLKQQLLKEIKTLEVQYRELQQQIKTDQDNAQSDIDTWWRAKQEEAAQEAQRIAEEAAATGYQAGFEQGVLQAKEEFQQKRHEMQELIQTAYEEKKKIILQSESFLLSLSIKVAEKVIKKELKQHDDQLIQMVRQTLKQIEESEDVVMQVSPEDYPVILPFLEELRTYVDSEFKLVPVPNLEQGSCMIHTANGSYDVTLDSQLEEIKKRLLAYFEEKTNDEPKD